MTTKKKAQNVSSLTEKMIISYSSHIFNMAQQRIKLIVTQGLRLMEALCQHNFHNPWNSGTMKYIVYHLLKLPFKNETPNSVHISLGKASHMVKCVGKYNLTI